MTTARDRVIDVLAAQTAGGGAMPVAEVDGTGLSDRDGRLATAIHRTVLQRYATLWHVLDRHLNQPMSKLEPMVRAILLCGAGQLLFMDKLPAHAVVNEAAEAAKDRVRPGAAGLVNAVLRKVATLVVERLPDERWRPDRSLLPLAAGEGGGPILGGGVIRLARPLLPNVEPLDRHLAVATSHPPALAAAWASRFGPPRATDMLLHSLFNAPTIVRCPDASAIEATLAVPHERAGYYVWRGDHASLTGFLAGGPGRWVQDVTAADAVAMTADRSPRLIVDYCAGRGTKTRALADLHRAARVIATDIVPARLAELQRLFAGHDRVRVVPFAEMARHRQSADLLVLDVPCSNTGVLARRLEARYRYSEHAIAELVALQRQIVAAAMPLRAPNGVVLYSTCSVEPAENEQVAAWIAEQWSLRIMKERATLPAGGAASYRDGGYAALLG